MRSRVWCTSRQPPWSEPQNPAGRRRAGSHTLAGGRRCCHWDTSTLRHTVRYTTGWCRRQCRTCSHLGTHKPAVSVVAYRASAQPQPTAGTHGPAARTWRRRGRHGACLAVVSRRTGTITLRVAGGATAVATRQAQAGTRRRLGTFPHAVGTSRAHAHLAIAHTEEADGAQGLGGARGGSTDGRQRVVTGSHLQRCRRPGRAIEADATALPSTR